MQPISFWDSAHAELSTPEHVNLRLEIANVGSRGLALMIDLAIRYGVFWVLYMILVMSARYPVFEALSGIGLKGFALLFILVVFVSEWFYFTVFEWIWNGQTPGKRLLHLRVIKIDGSPVGWLEVVLRNFTRPIDTTGPMALVGLAFIFFQSRSQRPGDLAARTLVIRETQIDWKSFLPVEKKEPLPGATPARAAIPLPPQAVELLQRYLQRAASLAPERRNELAATIRRTIQPRVIGTELEKSNLPHHEWLEELSKRL